MTLENQWLIIQYFLYPNCLLPCLEGHEVCVQQWVVHGGDELEKGSERQHPSHVHHQLLEFTQTHVH